MMKPADRRYIVFKGGYIWIQMDHRLRFIFCYFYPNMYYLLYVNQCNIFLNNFFFIFTEWVKPGLRRMGFFKQTEKTLDQKNFSFSLICCCVQDWLCKIDFLLPYLERELLLICY